MHILGIPSTITAIMGPLSTDKYNNAIPTMCYLRNNYCQQNEKHQSANPRRKCSAVPEYCVVAEYRIPYRIGLRTIITHAHRAQLIDGLGLRDLC